MSIIRTLLITASFLAVPFAPHLADGFAKDIQRPEKIVSKRQVVYDQDTYAKLAILWKQYYDEFPSEDAYANWMYAARYAGDENYEKLLDKGLKKFSANPTLLYLKSMTWCGKHNDIEGRQLLERATQLDPSYMDPWFGLIGIYMDQNDDERTDLALRNLLTGNAISEEVMDYNFNMLLELGKDAILITNGDNDTYPGWILTRLLNHRPDITIVNRSLLNTDWYPPYLMERGLPKFITKNKLEELRENIMSDIREKKASVPPGGPFGDTLIVQLINTAEKVRRPVHFAHTLYSTDIIDRYMESGRQLGLSTLVTTPTSSYISELKRIIPLWLNKFRTSGLDSWRLRYADSADAGRMLITNYASGLNILMESIAQHLPEYRADLFHWYQKHLHGVLSGKIADFMIQLWCEQKDVKVIQDWCRNLGYVE